MKIGDRMRIVFKNNGEIKRDIIFLPKNFGDLEKKCFECFDLENTESKYLFLKCYGQPNIYLVDKTYSEIFNKKDNNIFYEIEIKEHTPHDNIPNKEEYKLEQLEDEKNKTYRLLKEKKEEKFLFTLVNKGNKPWLPSFRVTNEKVSGDNLDLLTCSTETIYHRVEPNDEVQICVTITELNKKNKNAKLRIKISGSQGSNNKYPDNYVEYKFEILTAEEYYQNSSIIKDK